MRPHTVAFWAGLSAFFGNIIGLKVLEILTSNDWAQLAGAVVVSSVVGAAAYSKERLSEAKRMGERHDIGPEPEAWPEPQPRPRGPRVPGRGSPPYP